MKKTLFACMASMMMVILGCENEPNRYNISSPYDINFYVDTISGHLILTTVCRYSDNTCLSANSISLGKIDSTELIK
jgi:hypothetical protein